MNKLTEILKSKTVKIGSALLGAGAIVGIPLTYYLITNDNQPVVPPQIIEPPPIVVETDTINPVIIPTPPVMETETVDPVIVVPEPIEPEPVVPEPIEPEPVVPEPIEPEPEVVSLQADSRSVSVGSVTGGLLNPLRSVYDVGEPGSEGVDVDRSSLRITEIISNPTKGIVEIVNDGKNLLYTPDFEITQGMDSQVVKHRVFSEPTGLFVEIVDGGDAVKYKVVSDSEGVVKEVEGVTYINLDSENASNNASELSDLLSDNFSGDVVSSIRSNFRFSDEVISNDDLRLVNYFVDNGFSEDSIKVIMGLPEDLSPVRNVDDHSLRKLLAVEKSLYQNQAFIDSIHGTDTWPEDYSSIMKQASFVIPSFIEVIEGNKTINYDKLHLDEVFEKLGGEYTGLFSRGQNYVPFYGHLPLSDIPPHGLELIHHPRNLDLDAVLTQEEIKGNEDRDVSLILGTWGFTENGLRYHDAFYNPLTIFNENVINFSVLAVLDEFDYTLGKSLVDKSSDEINNLFDLLHETHDKNERKINPLFFSDGTTGGYGIVYGWENGFMSNGERTNVYNQVRHIIGLDVHSVSDGVFRLLDWLRGTKDHATSRPYIPNIVLTRSQQVEALNNLLPSNVFYPSVYHFIPREYDGIWFGSSKNYPGIVTSALRSLNVQSRQFNVDDGYFGSNVRAPPFNLGSIVIDSETWLYNGNFAFGNIEFKMRNVCRALFHEENLTLKKLREAWDDVEGNIHEKFFYENTEACDEYNLPLTR